MSEKKQYRIQFQNSLGPDSTVFGTESEAAEYAARQYPNQWADGQCWVIPDADNE